MTPELGISQGANEVADGAIHTHIGFLSANLGGQRRNFASDVIDVFLKLQNDVERVFHNVGVQRFGVEKYQGARPVDGFGDGRHLL